MLFVYMVHTNFIIIKFGKKPQKNIAISMSDGPFNLQYIIIIYYNIYIYILTTIGI